MNLFDTILKYMNNCFLLFVPILVFNVMLFKKLPAYYIKKINHPIVILETVIRILTIAFSIIMNANIQNKAGLTVYICGVIIYFSSYFIEIYFSETFFAKKLVVLLAPYWTSIIWLLGIGLIGNNLFINIPYHFTFYMLLSVLFTTIHTIHGYMCYKMYLQGSVK